MRIRTLANRMGQSDYDLFLAQLAKKREPAMQQARELAERGEYDQLSAIVRRADDSIYGAVALAKMLEQHLRELVASNPKTDDARLRIAFERALDVAQSAYPEPHTEYEAADYERGRAEDLARLIQI